MYDPNTTQLIVIPDNSESPTYGTTLIPYLVYPVNEEGMPIKTDLNQVVHSSSKVVLLVPSFFSL